MSVSGFWRKGFVLAGIVLLVWGKGVLAADRIEASHDPEDQLFRFAPVAETPRNVTLRLAPGVFLGFDTEKLRTHSAWQHATFDLYGPPYSRTKEPFICRFSGERLWSSPVVTPWSASAAGVGALSGRFRGLEVDGGEVSLAYDVSAGQGKAVRIRELPRWRNGGVVRRIEVGPCPFELWFLAHAGLGSMLESNRRSSEIAVLPEGKLHAELVSGNAVLESKVRPVDYLQDIVTEAGTEKEWQRERIQGNQAEIYVRVPAHDAPVQFEIWSGGNAPAKEGAAAAGELENRVPVASAPRRGKVTAGDPKALRPATGDEYYQIEHFPVPEALGFLVGGMDWLPNGDLAVCTWLGEVYIVEKPQGALMAARYRRFARGLNEPLGLKVVDGDIYVVQKSGLLRLRDRDGDGEADEYEMISQGWGFSGNYHSFAFGPAVDSAKDFYIGITGQHGRADISYQGWCVRVSRDGSQMEGFCHGLRVPNGFAIYEGDLFCTDNEGNWIGACKLNHLRRGKFYGFPSSAPASPKDEEVGREFEPPAIWFPRNLAPSASDIAVIRDDAMGKEFRGQLLVGDFQNASVLRVQLEKVNGEWQGAVWMFAKGFLSAVNRLSYGPDGKVYVGGCQRTWSAAAPQEYCLDRIRPTGKLPFEVSEVHATRAGFELKLTQPVDSASAADVENFRVTQFGFQYHPQYGSPEVDQEGRPNRATEIAVRKVEASGDGMRLRLELSGLRPGFVTMVRGAGVQSKDGGPLWHDTFYYTLNGIPGGR